MARNRASMREGPLAELFRATEAAQRQGEQAPESAPPAPTPEEEPQELTVEHVPDFAKEEAAAAAAAAAPPEPAQPPAREPASEPEMPIIAVTSSDVYGSCSRRNPPRVTGAPVSPASTFLAAAT